MFTEATCDAEQGSLNLAAGPASGPPLLFLHGVTRRWQDCLPLAPALVLRWHLFALDFRGHGRSGRMPGQYLVKDYVDDAIGLLDAPFTEPVVIYGHSLGALVAAALAARRPAAVRAIVLSCWRIRPRRRCSATCTLQCGTPSSPRCARWQAPERQYRR